MAIVVQLRRYNTSQPWGFKMQGGTDVGGPLYAAHVSPNSISGHAGLKAGDAILRIGGTDAMSFTHEQARGEMIRCGNEVDLTVQRGAVQTPVSHVVEEEQPRMSVSDDGGPYQDVTSKTFQKLEEEQASVVVREWGYNVDVIRKARISPSDRDLDNKGYLRCSRPASIFDKKRQKRSEYTKAEKSGYMKCIGQK